MHGVAVHPTLVWTGAPGSALDTLDPFAYELTQAQEEADRLLVESVAGWAEKYPDVLVERAAVFDASVASALARLSGSAAMAVVCARSHPRLSPLLLGSVTRTLLWSSGCPLAIVRPPGRVRLVAYIRDAVVPIGPSSSVASALPEGGQRGDGEGEPINMGQYVDHRP